MTDYLRCRRGRYLIQVRVPRDLKHAYKGQVIERYLRTGDKGEAKEQASAVHATIIAEFKAKREGSNLATIGSAMSHVYDVFRSSAFNLIAEGDATAGTLPRIDVAAMLKSYGIEADENMVRAFAIMIAGGRAAGASRIENRAGPPADPKPWRRPIASGEAVETLLHLDEYLATLADSNEPKSVAMKGSTIRKFCAEFPSLADVDRPAVQRWANRQDRAADTVRRYLSEMRGYWSYLRSIQIVADDSNPFDKLTLPVAGKNAKADERKPFTAAEVVNLLSEARKRGDGELADLVELGMWTGARIEEICALTIAKVNLKARHFDIADAKTQAGWRQVPIASKLLPTLRRLIGTRTTGYVLPGLSENKYGDRSNAIGKRFGRLKGDMGFGPQHVFHSIRKTVSTQFENAGVLENVAADILGHEKPRITYGLYSGGTSLTVKREAIEKLRYPKGLK